MSKLKVNTAFDHSMTFINLFVAMVDKESLKHDVTMHPCTYGFYVSGPENQQHVIVEFLGKRGCMHFTNYKVSSDKKTEWFDPADMPAMVETVYQFFRNNL